MKAVIFNSGIGIRMKSLTKNKPKCLLEINSGQTILGRQIKSLISLGIHEFIITTGPYPEMIYNYINKLFPDIKVTYIQNNKYATTNYIYSMYLARDYILDNIILLHGDIVTRTNVFKTIITSKDENCATVFSDVPLPEKDFKALIIDNEIKKISVKLKGVNCYFLLPIYKLTKEAMTLWMEKVSSYIIQRKTGVYAEEALNECIKKLILKPIYLNNDLCMEIDNQQDFSKAKRILANEE